MAKPKFRAVENQAEWEAYVAKHPEANFLHAWLWGDYGQALKKKIYRVGLYDGDALLGVWLGTVEDARRGRFMTIAGGPLLDSWSNKPLVDTAIDSIKQVGKQEKCVFVRVRPQLLETKENRTLFKQLGFMQAKMHLQAELTSQLDITRSEDELLQGFRKKTRYELKQATKREIVVTSSTKPDDIKQFYDLQLQTAQRHGFVPFSLAYLQEEFRAFAQDGKATLYSAHTKGGELIAQAFIIFYGQEAAYHYGASTELGRTEPGAYLLQWEAIKEAKSRGMVRYNFWGVVGPEQTAHRFYGVSIFKRGFRGEDVSYLHAHDLVLNKLLYLPNWAIETVRKKRRRL